MLTISPFRALMPPADKAGAIAAVPYDVVDTDEAAKLAAGNPLSFLRVSRPEIELPAETDIHSDAVYDQAAANFARLRQEAPLDFDEEASFYVYSQCRDGHRQTGLVVAASVDDYDEGRIKQHEKTRRDKEDDRTRHTMSLRAHSGPVFLVCRSAWSMDSSMQEIMGEHDPLYDVTAEDGTQHQVWRVPEAYNHLLEVLFKRMKGMYIADGHHRAKSASRAREECRSQNPNHRGDEDYNRFLAVVFPHNQLRILPYNRLVHDLNGLKPKALRRQISESFDITKAKDGEVKDKRDIHMYLDGQWYKLNAISVPADSTPSQLLDVSILQDQLLQPLLGIDDPRSSDRISFIGGIRGTDYLRQQVDQGEGAVAFSMYPTTVDELMAISDAGEIMPPKSTWFEPKLRDGLLIHCF